MSGPACSEGTDLACSLIVRAVGDTNHAVFIFNLELELTAATICTDSASTRQALNRKQSWSEDKQRHAGTAFLYVRSLVRQGAAEVLAVNGKDNVSDTLTKPWLRVNPATYQ